MRAILIKNGSGPLENLYIGEAPTPSPEPHHVLVQIKAFGLNRMDISQRLGKYPVPPGASSILGVEFSGIITQLGSNVDDWKVGDEVFGLASGGAYAEFIRVPATHIIAKPKEISWIDAAAIPEAWITAFQALIVIAELKEGESVLIHAGASGVGIAAAQLAHLQKAKTIISTSTTASKLEFLKTIPNGPTDTIDTKAHPTFETEVKRITDGTGVNVIIDFVAATFWASNIESLSLDGRMTMLAVLGGTNPPTTNLLSILYKRLRIQGSTLRSRTEAYQADLITRFKKEVIPHFGPNGLFKVYIHKVYKWTDIQDAHREMESNANSGKIIVEVI